jgi:NAD(P)-dependent dehydrogenase (short-subunit alcohol dehydrogenase family)
MTDTTTRTALVTGATEGIGHEVARQLAAEGAHVILHARTPDEGSDAVDRLVKGGADPLYLDLVVADFARMAEVAALGREVARRYPRLDLLVNNAALAAGARRTVTEDGHEVTFQVNYLAHYVLTRLLWEPLTATGTARVVNVSSSMHRLGHLHWSDPALSGSYAPVAAYAQAKLALTMFGKGLAEHGKGELTAVSVHPGLTDTKLMPVLYGRFGNPVADGARPVLHLASPKVGVGSGDYYEGIMRAPAARLVNDRKSVERLWRLSSRLAGNL